MYLLQFCLAIPVGMEVHGVLESSIGQSLEINRLVKDFDYTVMTDFLKTHGASITPLIGHVRWLILVYLLFSVFINGGLLACAAAPQRASGQYFWTSGARYFFRFLKVGFVVVVVALVWTTLLWVPFLANAESALQWLPSEKYVVWGALILAFLYLIGLAVLFLCSVLWRFVILHKGGKLAACARQAWGIFCANKYRFFKLLGFFVALQLMALGLYLFLETVTGMSSPVLIPIFFIVQQAYVFFRIQLRQMMYMAIDRYTTTNS